MSTLGVIVKGDRYQAAKAAAERGIPFVFVSEAREPATTTGRVSTEHQDRVAAWFCEDAPKAPFPVGACLHYYQEGK